MELQALFHDIARAFVLREVRYVVRHDLHRAELSAAAALSQFSPGQCELIELVRLLYLGRGSAMFSNVLGYALYCFRVDVLR